MYQETAMANESLVLGIDFGTTNTAAAWCDLSGKIHLVPTGPKSFVLPSVVWYGSKNRVLVGQPARQQILDDPYHTIYGIKRIMGQRYASEHVARLKDQFPFKVVEDKSGLAAVQIYQTVVPLTDIVYTILEKIVKLANEAANEEFEECVLTVPAHFSFSQRKALRFAAAKLGLHVRAVVNEPTAAALYYAKHKDVSQKVLVFDLGGGTFDATLLGIERRVVQVLGTGGETFLGGTDFDHAIAENLCERFAVEQGLDLRRNKIVMQRLLSAAETAKISLTKEESTRMKVPFVAQQDSNFLDLDQDISRESLESITDRLIVRTVGITEDMLAAANIAQEDVGEIVFVGGQTRMPAIQRRLGQKFRHDPKKNLHPELGVAIGAAILGRTVNLPRGPELIDVVPIPIGVMMPGVGTLEVIGKNTAVPVTDRVRVEKRPEPGKPLAFAVYEALDPASVDRELLGTVRAEADWLEAHPGELEIELRLGRDFDLSVTLVPENGDTLQIDLLPPKQA